MTIPTQHTPVRKLSEDQGHPNRRHLRTPLANPWHYRRSSGVYYLRVRPVGSCKTLTLSLRSTDRPTAMSTSKHLQTTLRAFHLDNPDATWEELRDHLRTMAEGILASPTEWDRLDTYGLVYSDVQDDLHQIASTAALSVPQAQAVRWGGEIMKAAQRRLRGDTGELVRVIREINGEPSVDTEGQSSVSLSVGPSSMGTSGSPSGSTSGPLTFGALSDLYLEERKDNLRPTTVKDIRSTCGVLASALGGLDFRTHTRSDIVNLKSSLLEGRKPSSVNKMLTRLTSVMDWAVNAGHLDRSLASGLLITGKAAESARGAFSQDQVKSIMAYANGLPESSWERWGVSLGVLTGARIGEVHQLTGRDVREVGGVWVIDINDKGGKTLKNKHSDRLVPLIDGAYGFDLQAFLRFAHKEEGGDSCLFTKGSTWFSNGLNGALREATGASEADGGDSTKSHTFHSLRHSLASLLRAHGVSAEIAQDILGHSSKTITYDRYGAGSQVAVGIMEEAMRRAFFGS